MQSVIGKDREDISQSHGKGGRGKTPRFSPKKRMDIRPLLLYSLRREGKHPLHLLEEKKGQRLFSLFLSVIDEKER